MRPFDQTTVSASVTVRDGRRALSFLRRMSDGPGRRILLSLVLGIAGWTKGSCRILSKLLCSNSASASLLTRTGAIVAAIDLVASKDEGSASLLRANLAAMLFGPVSICRFQTGSSSKVKLAYVSNSAVPSPAANCVHAIKMCAALRRQGICVTLFAESPTEDVPLKLNDFDVVDKFEYVRVEAQCSGMGTDFFKAYNAVQSAPSHLFTRSPKVAYLSALCGIPTLLEMHAPPTRSIIPFVRDLSRLRSFRGLIVITGTLREEIRRIIPSLADKTYVIPDAADPPKLDVSVFDLVRTETAALHVGYVGHLYPGKGLELIVELAARLPNFMFHILGGDPADVGRWKQAKGVSGNIVFYGHRPHADVPAFLSAIDVAVAPYRRKVFARGNTLDIARWMSPLKLFEYMASAKAIVSSDLPALREVLVNGRNALLIDPDNLDRWVETLELLRADPGLRQALGREARKDFEQNFTWSRRAERILCRLVGEKEAHGGTEFSTQGQRSTGVEAPRSNRSRAGKSVPSIWWFYEDKLSEWAYGINSRRLASRLNGFDHHFGSQPAQRGDRFDLMVCLDILNYAEKHGTASNRTIMRIGGPKPLMQIGGKGLDRLKEAFSDFAAIIAVSPELEAAAAAFHPNVFLIPNGTDLRLWHPAVLQGCDGRRSFRAGFAAAVKTADQRQVKGVDIAINACKRAGIELIVVGRGGDQVPHDRMIADFYSEIDVLVHPVGPGKEGSSNVIMECLALGVPVITTFYAGYHAEKLRDRHDVLFARRDHESFAAALIEIRNNGELRNQLSTGGRAFAEAHHDLDLIGRQYEKVFRVALGMDKPNQPRPC
jgi:glycosyltransferase involved in cell wall biosynthesis